MERNCKTVTYSRLLTHLFIAGGLFLGAAQAAEVFRWVDENGEVHYSETLPTHLKEKTHDVLNERGIVTDENLSTAPPPPKAKEPVSKDEPAELPRDASGLPRPKALYSESEMQQQMDNLLLLRYDSELEITDAMNIEIKQLNYDRRLLLASRKSMDDAYRGQIRIAAEKQRAGIQVEEAAVQEIDTLQSNLAENQFEIDSLQQREDNIRNEFQAQVDRYRYLIDLSEEAEAEG